MVFGEWSATHFMQAEGSLGGLSSQLRSWHFPCVAQLSSSCVKKEEIFESRTVQVLCSRISVIDHRKDHLHQPVSPIPKPYY